jgi:sporulation protein YlmC with PRC-barrel domain
MLFTEMRQRPIVATTTATTLGQVDDAVVDPRTQAIVALRVRGRGHDVVHWPDIDSIGPDAVTVASADAVGEPEGRAAELASGPYRMLGKRVLADTGHELGHVVDIVFEPTTGALTGAMTTGGRIDGERLIGCGSYAVVVRGGGTPIRPAGTG